MGGAWAPAASELLQNLSGPLQVRWLCHQRARPALEERGRAEKTLHLLLRAPEAPSPISAGPEKVPKHRLKDARSHTHEVTAGYRWKGIVANVF